MTDEFILPIKYNGDNCGISAIISGLNGDCKYEKFSISIDDEEHEVVMTEQLQTTAATFNNLSENKYYTVIAKITIDGDTKSVSCKATPSVLKPVGVARSCRGYGRSFMMR